MTYYIYEISNQTTGKSYVGCTKTVQKRVREHRRARPEIFEGNAYTVEILEECQTLEAAFAAEVFWILEKNTFENGYNFQTGGRTGAKAHPQTKALMSQNQTGRTHTAETIAKIIASNKGKKRTAAFREHMSKIRTGAKGTYNPAEREDWPERLAKMVAGRKGKGSWCKGLSGPKMSEATKKAWDTRRAKGTASESAKKGWAARRAKAVTKSAALSSHKPPFPVLP